MLARIDTTKPGFQRYVPVHPFK